MNTQKLLMISTDRKIFDEGSAVRARQVEYAKEWDEVHIIVFDEVISHKSKVKSEAQDTKLTTGESADSCSANLQLETVVAPNCWAYSSASWTKWMYPFDAMKLGRFLIQKRGITHITCQDLFLTAMAGVALKKEFPQVMLELQVHTDIGSPYYTYSLGNKVRKFLALNYLPKADTVRVVSNKIKKYVESVVISKNELTIQVRPIFVDTDTIRTAPIIPEANLREKYPQFDKIVLMASRLEKEKNVGLAIDAWVEVVKKIPKAGLIIVGEGGESAKLKAAAQGPTSKSDLGLLQPQNSVIFENWADHATLYSYYKTADLFLNTSLFEGYGMTLVEAHAAGCKIVSTDVGVAREVGADIVGWDTESVVEGVVKNL